MGRNMIEWFGWHVDKTSVESFMKRTSILEKLPLQRAIDTGAIDVD